MAVKDTTSRRKQIVELLRTMVYAPREAAILMPLVDFAAVFCQNRRCEEYMLHYELPCTHRQRMIWGEFLYKATKACYRRADILTAYGFTVRAFNYYKNAYEKALTNDLKSDID